MSDNAFIGKKLPPTYAELTKALGKSKTLWTQLISTLTPKVPTTEWNSYSPKAGWALKLKSKDRTILYLSPCDGCFRASFVLGSKAVQSAKESDLPKSILKLISESKTYAEGTGIRLDVKTAKDILVILKLAEIKLNN
jgi:hypothetical protein